MTKQNSEDLIPACAGMTAALQKYEKEVLICGKMLL